jgi:hypothetical protein
MSPITPPSDWFDIPPEIMLHICVSSLSLRLQLLILALFLVSYLDLPDLAAIVQVSPVLASLASDPVLHRNRLKVVAPSRLQHSLYGADQHGLAFRPTVGDLVHRGVMCGLDIERRWRLGLYFYSHNVSHICTTMMKSSLTYNMF